MGAGFIGLEMAENLHRAGAGVSIVEMGNQVMAPVDFSIASHVHQHLLQKGVHLYLEQSVERLPKNGDDKIEVFFTSGKSIATDLVILSIGVRPETALAKAAGLRIGETGGIWVDDYLQSFGGGCLCCGRRHRISASADRQTLAKLPGQSRQPPGTHRGGQHGLRQYDPI